MKILKQIKPSRKTIKRIWWKILLIINLKTMNQVKNSWDYETLEKVGRGAAIAGGSAAAIYLLQWIMTVDDFGAYTPAMVAIAGIIINAIREYRKGIAIDKISEEE